MTASDRWDVIGVGANSVDFVHLLPAYPRPVGAFAKMQIRERHVLCGGQTATTISTCASFGLRSKYVGAVGADENGRRIRQELERRRVDVTDLVVRDAENQFATILIDETTGERIVLWKRDDRLCLHEGELPADALARARVVHVDDTDEAAALYAARIGRDAGALVTSDIDRITPRTLDLVRAVTHAILAEHVPAQLTGIEDVEQALREMRKNYRGVLVVTRGDRGACALEETRFYNEAAFDVAAVDTTGAGDVFRGGFIFALLQGQPIERALRTANAAAAVSCTRLGALDGVPTPDEVQSLTTANVQF